MKISTLLSVAFVTATQFTNAVPVAQPSVDNTTMVDDEFLHVQVLGVGYHHEQHLKKRWLEKRDTAKGLVTGTRKGYDPNGAYRIPRQEIRALYADQGGRIFDLYLLALERMQAKSRTDPNSWYQLAGIHGRPYLAWHSRTSGDSRYRQAGYCTHGSTLFPTWHRPYLAYFEEVVWQNAAEVVATEKEWKYRQLWYPALDFLRIPYWDWATGGGDVPWQIRAATWNYRFYPNVQGRTVSRPNPIYSYKFASNQKDSGSFPNFPFNTWENTLRSPSGNNAGATSNNAASNSAIAGNYNSRRQRVYQLMANNNKWSTFSNKASAAEQNFDSLEAIHDEIHGSIGGGGHMSYVEYSSFDPVFFLHHTNVDRLFAIWQAINWRSVRDGNFATRQTNQGGTYGIVPGTVDDVNTPLMPFVGLSWNPYNSGATIETKLFGYQYNDVPKNHYGSTDTELDKLANFAASAVAKLYGGSGFTAPGTKRKRDGEQTAVDNGVEKSIVGVDQYYNWRIDIVADKSALNGTYTVHFFLGKPSRDPSQWSSQPEHVGDYVIFTHTMQAAPGIDPAQINNNVTGSVPLTDDMVNAFATTLKSTQPSDAIPYLEKNLRWRVTDNDGKAHRAKDVKGLNVAVSVALCTLPNDNLPLGSCQDWTHLADIVRKIGRDGGPDQVGVVPSPSVSATSVAPTTVSSTPSDVATSTTDATTEAPTSTVGVEFVIPTPDVVTTDATTATAASSEAPTSTAV
ncbi:hypothetical protein H072_7156 [Dactylellina haptotyla CBS 200.50]|uniref:tyrosinase n=1 Tax=Dactylellina haptotyla (strain CBS 200.50) TaxID=1284197 RepID=S8A895_DACHA|nr:hypothetical protein H072_7156 [Dactylellina haptotyla CBS 200.50]